MPKVDQKIRPIVNNQITSGFKVSDYITSGKAAELLGVTQTTIRNWSKSGKLKTYLNPMSGFRLYKLKDILKALETIRGDKSAF